MIEITIMWTLSILYHFQVNSLHSILKRKINVILFPTIECKLFSKAIENFKIVWQMLHIIHFIQYFLIFSHICLFPLVRIFQLETYFHLLNNLNLRCCGSDFKEQSKFCYINHNSTTLKEFSIVTTVFPTIHRCEK